MKFLIRSVNERNSYPPPARVSPLKGLHADPLWEVEISTLEELVDYIRACGDNVVIRLAVNDIYKDLDVDNVVHTGSLTVYDRDPAYYNDRSRK